jgi:geranylgeranyl diphosphate synthase type II
MNSESQTKFDLIEYLHRQAGVVDRALDRYLDYAAERETIFRAVRYGVFPGGKRIRPILTLATGELFGAAQQNLLPFACAVELIHAYSLIHDDLPALDDDDLRRGEPTAHKVFGEGTALLAGDGLLTEAFHLLSGPEVSRYIGPELVLKLIHELSGAVGLAGLVGGQALDLEAENKVVDLALVESIHARKTGALIRVSIRLGAQVAGADAANLDRISRFGTALGLAFQIADDILDGLGETAAGERAESARLELKKATYPAVAGMSQARAKLTELLQTCLHELAPYGGAAVPLRELACYVATRALHQDASLPSEVKI